MRIDSTHSYNNYGSSYAVKVEGHSFFYLQGKLYPTTKILLPATSISRSSFLRGCRLPKRSNISWMIDLRFSRDVESKVFCQWIDILRFTSAFSMEAFSSTIEPRKVATLKTIVFKIATDVITPLSTKQSGEICISRATPTMSSS